MGSNSAEYMRRYRAEGRDQLARRARSRAMNRAVSFVIAKHPYVWQQLMDEAAAEVGYERKAAHRPSRKGHE